MGLLKATINKFDSPAILIGNGINLCYDLFPSWNKLLEKYTGLNFNSEGLTNTEIYDFIDMKAGDTINLKSAIAHSFNKDQKKQSEIHEKFIDLVIHKDCPVLTTNFDFTLETSLFPNNGSFYRKNGKWSSHFRHGYPKM